ncbi:MAG TPA: hypothetical protein VG204_01310 [Terriglobia bacterium]|nr:hypothetical protein [Terriglobia bacterium]
MPGGPEVEALKALAAHSQSWADWSTLIVFIGLLGEIGIAFAYTKDKPRSEIILGVACGVIIAFGVYGEYTFGSKAAQANSRLRILSEQQLAQVTRDVGNTREAAETAARAAARAVDSSQHANAEADKIKRQAIELQITLARLQRLVGPRFISPEERESIISSLHLYPRNTIEIREITGDSEAKSYAEEIIDSMSGTGWTVKPDRGTLEIGPPFHYFYGLHCYLSSKPSPGVRRFMSIFQKFGVDMTLHPSEGATTNQLTVLVGYHRPYTQLDFKTGRYRITYSRSK